MPVKRTAWACKWGCGRNVLSSRKGMADHESRCFYNPARRACKSCRFWTYDVRDNVQVAVDAWSDVCGWECDHPDNDDPETLAAECRWWKPKDNTATDPTEGHTDEQTGHADG